jgi:hypothetical protein
MSKFSKLLVAALAIVVIAGCEGTEEDLPGLVKVRMLHASPDAPRLILRVTGPFGDVAAGAIDYKKSPGSVDVRFGKAVVEIETIRPGGNQTEFTLSDFALTDESNYELMVVGKIADMSLDTLIFSNPQSEVSAGKFRVQFVHASPDTADLIIYFTAPDAMLDGAPSMGPIGFTGTLAPFEDTAGNYQIRMALASDPLIPIFDTGSVALAAGGDLMLAVVTNTGAGDAPITIVAQQEGIEATELLDVNTPTDLRFVHAAPDAPALDLTIDDEMTPSFAGISFAEFSDYLDPPLAPATYDIKVVDSPVPGTVEAIVAAPTLVVGVAQSILATGLFANLPLSGALLTDDNRRVATEARLRIVHASNIAGTVDVYFATPGAAIDNDSLALQNLTLRSTLGYSALAEGDYEITVTEANEPTNVLIDATPISLVNGGIYTAIAIDAVGGIAPVGWILMDDFAP